MALNYTDASPEDKKLFNQYNASRTAKPITDRILTRLAALLSRSVRCQRSIGQCRRIAKEGGRRQWRANHSTQPTKPSMSSASNRHATSTKCLFVLSSKLFIDFCISSSLLLCYGASAKSPKVSLVYLWLHPDCFRRRIIRAGLINLRRLFDV